MRYYRSDVTAVMGNHTIAERMFRHETAMTKLRSPRVP